MIADRSSERVLILLWGACGASLQAPGTRGRAPQLNQGGRPIVMPTFRVDTVLEGQHLLQGHYLLPMDKSWPSSHRLRRLEMIITQQLSHWDRQTPSKFPSCEAFPPFSLLSDCSLGETPAQTITPRPSLNEENVQPHVAQMLGQQRSAGPVTESGSMSTPAPVPRVSRAQAPTQRATRPSRPSGGFTTTL